MNSARPAPAASCSASCLRCHGTGRDLSVRARAVALLDGNDEKEGLHDKVRRLRRTERSAFDRGDMVWAAMFGARRARHERAIARARRVAEVSRCPGPEIRRRLERLEARSARPVSGVVARVLAQAVGPVSVTEAPMLRPSMFDAAFGADGWDQLSDVTAREEQVAS